MPGSSSEDGRPATAEGGHVLSAENLLHEQVTAARVGDSRSQTLAATPGDVRRHKLVARLGVLGGRHGVGAVVLQVLAGRGSRLAARGMVW